MIDWTDAWAEADEYAREARLRFESWAFAGGYCDLRTRSTQHPECVRYGHVPNARGTACEVCHLAAEPGDPDDLAAALCAALDTLYAQVPGQLGWADA